MRAVDATSSARGRTDAAEREVRPPAPIEVGRHRADQRSLIETTSARAAQRRRRSRSARPGRPAARRRPRRGRRPPRSPRVERLRTEADRPAVGGAHGEERVLARRGPRSQPVIASAAVGARPRRPPGRPSPSRASKITRPPVAEAGSGVPSASRPTSATLSLPAPDVGGAEHAQPVVGQHGDARRRSRRCPP